MAKRLKMFLNAVEKNYEVQWGDFMYWTNCPYIMKDEKIVFLCDTKVINGSSTLVYLDDFVFKKKYKEDIDNFIYDLIARDNLDKELVWNSSAKGYEFRYIQD